MEDSGALRARSGAMAIRSRATPSSPVRMKTPIRIKRNATGSGNPLKSMRSMAKHEITAPSIKIEA